MKYDVDTRCQRFTKKMEKRMVNGKIVLYMQFDVHCVSITNIVSAFIS